MGATVGRAGADWAATEPNRPVGGRARFDWTYDDMIATAMAQARLRWDPMLDYTPAWAQQHIRPAVSVTGLVSELPPADDRVYAAYAAAFAARYGAGGSFWRGHPGLPAEPVRTFEIWNEPDCRWTWGPDVDLRDYARLYATAYRAIKRVDPRSTVITGGLAFTRSSLPRLLRAFRGVPIDGLGVHPYGPTAEATIAVVRFTERLMTAYGRSATPLFVNEYGWNSVSGSWQAVPRDALHGDIVRSVVGLAAIEQVREVIPFEWADASWGLSDGALAGAISQAQQRRER